MLPPGGRAEPILCQLTMLHGVHSGSGSARCASRRTQNGSRRRIWPRKASASNLPGEGQRATLDRQTGGGDSPSYAGGADASGRHSPSAGEHPPWLATHWEPSVRFCCRFRECSPLCPECSRMFVVHSAGLLRHTECIPAHSPHDSPQEANGSQSGANAPHRGANVPETGGAGACTDRLCSAASWPAARRTSSGKTTTAPRR